MNDDGDCWGRRCFSLFAARLFLLASTVFCTPLPVLQQGAKQSSHLCYFLASWRWCRCSTEAEYLKRMLTIFCCPFHEARGKWVRLLGQLPLYWVSICTEKVKYLKYCFIQGLIKLDISSGIVQRVRLYMLVALGWWQAEGKEGVMKATILAALFHPRILLPIKGAACFSDVVSVSQWSLLQAGNLTVFCWWLQSCMHCQSAASLLWVQNTWTWCLSKQIKTWNFLCWLLPGVESSWFFNLHAPSEAGKPWQDDALLAGGRW